VLELILQMKINERENVEKIQDYIWSLGIGAKKIVISSCIHGDEIIGIKVINDLIDTIKYDLLVDCEIIFIICNPRAVELKKRFIDVDMNRRFSSENINKIKESSNIECHEDRAIKGILKCIDNVNYLFDIHSTTLPSIPFIYCANTNKHNEIAKMFDVEYIVSPSDKIINEYPEFSFGFDNYVDSQGGIGVTIEAGCNNDNNVDVVVNGIISFLVKNKFYKDQSSIHINKSQKQILLEKALFASNDNCKFFTNDIKNFSFFHQNDIISIDGDREIRANNDCFIVFPKNDIQKSICYALIGVQSVVNTNNRIWAKSNTPLDNAIHNYIFSKDLSSDKRLLYYDVIGSIAHVDMLNQIKLISDSDFKDLKKELLNIIELHQNNQFSLDGFEDIHSAVEHHLTQKLGDIGKRIHIARSRNDQVLTDLRLFTKDKLINIKNSIQKLSKTIADFAIQHEFIPLPGFTHMQYAMPSSIGQWSGSFLESILNDVHILKNAILINDQNPLGSAAGFGTNINIDRNYTTQKLNFAKVQSNSLFCQNSRGKFEVYTISCLYQIMVTLSKMANDIVIFCSQEFQYLKLSDAISTGSSIMPQKRNPDPLEVVRGNCSKVFSHLTHIAHLSNNLISGYNKDMKFTKDAIIETIDITESSINIFDVIFKNIFVNEEKLFNIFKTHNEIFAADIANDLVLKNNIPFRDAYLIVKEQIKNYDNNMNNTDIINNLKQRKHIGATGNLMINETLQAILGL
jgi:argininosuccinate lyase